MKKIYTPEKFSVVKFVCIVFFLIGTGTNSNAQYAFIPDPNFRAWLMNNGFAACMNGDSLDTTCPAVLSETFMECSNSSISDLTGIEYFSSLSSLWCGTNQLTDVPVLPSSLTEFRPMGNQLTSLTNLPSSLVTLDCRGNQLTALPTLPPSLGYLNVDNNFIVSWPVLPSSLWYFSCTYNDLFTLPALPSNLEHLDCTDNQISVLPALPNSLTSLFCYNNHLTALPSPLPTSLTQIFCEGNWLTYLPDLPVGMSILDCSNNLITSLPALPPAFNNLNCSDNPIACLPAFTNITNLTWNGTLISCRPFIGNIVNATPSISTLPLCQVSSGCPIAWNISGKLFDDRNGNCIQDIGEADLSGIPIVLDSGGVKVQSMSTDLSGSFSFIAGLGNYTVRVDSTLLPFVPICPLTFSQPANVTPVDSVIGFVDFALQCEPGFDLMAKSISPSLWFRPGATRTLYLNAGEGGSFYGTSCASGIGGSVQVILGSFLNYVSPAPGALVPTSVSGNIISWNVSDFGLTDPTHDFNIVVQVDPFVSTSDSLCVNLDIMPTLGDNDDSNNSLYTCFPVRNSFDPNEKYMSPSGFVNSQQEWFNFTVFFQNTGNAPAEDIYILDSLDQNFDAASFTFLSSSHDAVTQMLQGNVLRFNFPDINLIDNLTNEPGSHGYISFKVRRKDGLPFNTTLTNTAHIFFDFNPPVVTNQASATLILIIGMDETAIPGFEIYPNPANEEFTVYGLQFPVNQNLILNVYDILGKEMCKQQIAVNSKLQIGKWPAGIYIVELSFDGRKTVRKLVVE